MHSLTDNIKQLLSYGVVGGIAAFVDITSFYFLVKYALVYYPIAIFFSFTLGTFTNFFVCNAFIFNRGNLPFQRALLRHYFSSLGGLTTNEVVVFMLISYGFQNILLAKIIATVSAFFVNFTLIKFYAFNNNVSLMNKIRSIK